MSLTRMIWRNVIRRPIRSLLAICAVAMATLAGLILPALAWGMESAWTEVYNARKTHLVARHHGGQGFLPNDFSLASLAGIEALPGISRVAPVLSEWMEISPMETVLVHGWEPGSFLHEHLILLQEADVDSENSVLLGETLADLFSLKAGDILAIGSESLPIRAVYRSPAMNENFCVIVPLPTLGKILGRENCANYLNIRVESGADLGLKTDLIKSIEKQFPDLRVFLASGMAMDNPGMRISRAMGWVTSLLALVIAALGVGGAVLAASLERSRENALLAALGWSPDKIRMLVVFEALLLSGAGSAIGILAGMLFVQLPSLLPAWNLPIAPVLPPVLPVGLFTGNLLLAFGCAVSPAIRAARKLDISLLQRG